MKNVKLKIRPLSAQILGFDDTLIVIIGSFINAIIMISLLYKHLFSMGYYTMILKLFLALYLIMLIQWSIVRAFYMKLVARYPGSQNILRRLARTPFLLILYVLVIYLLDYLVGPILFIEKDLNLTTELTLDTIAGILIAIINLGLYEALHIFVELQEIEFKKVQIEKQMAFSSLNTFKHQMNPGFLFSSLKRLEQLIDGNKDAAIQFLNKLSRIYKTVVRVSEKKTIFVIDELNHTNNYVNLLKSEFKQTPQLKIIVRNNVNQKIVPLTLHILVEELLKFKNKSTPHEFLEFIINPDILELRYPFKNEWLKEFKESEGFKYVETRYNKYSSRKIKITNHESNITVKIPLLG